MPESSQPKLSLFFRKRVPIILQAEAAECGLACVAAIAGYHGHQIELSGLRLNMGGSLKGVTLASVMRMASELKLSPRALRLEPAGLHQLSTPCILHWNLDHFVVLERVNGNKCTIIDPSIGRRKLTRQELSKHFTGVALELVPTTDFAKRKRIPALTFTDMLKGVEGLSGALFRLFMLSLALQVFALTTPFYSQLVIDEVISSRNLDLLTLLAIAFGTAALLNTVISAARSIALLFFGAKLQFSWNVRLFRHLLRLPLSYFERRHIADVQSRFRSLVAVQGLVTNTIVESIIDGIMAVTTLAVMLLYSPTLTFITAIALTLYLTIRFVAYSPQRAAMQEAIVRAADENGHFLESLRGILAIKSFSKEHLREAAWQTRAAEAVRTSTVSSAFSTGERILNQFIFALENILVVWFGARLIMDGSFSVGMLVAFLAFKMQFTSRASALIDKIVEFQMSSVHFDRLADIAGAEPEQGLSAESLYILPIRGSLEVRNANFRYASGEPYVLHNVNLRIDEGECLSICAPSGSGKTTLLKLLMGLLVPESGEVFVDGKDIQSLSLSTYRRQIASVMQEDTLLSGNLADNIAFFDASPDSDRIIHCAKLAQIHNDIMSMPMGYATLVGDMGGALSGGQRQRILLARAIYAQPKILFLDEATCHLDTQTEKRIHNALSELDITRILVSHRQETLSIADRTLQLHEIMGNSLASNVVDGVS